MIMGLEETEARNDCAGEDQQQFNRPTEPGLTEDLCVVHKEEFSVTRYMCDTYTRRNVKHIHKRQTHLLVREDVT
jgi:hypothetical protein